jgi:TPR repeat protein
MAAEKGELKSLYFLGLIYSEGGKGISQDKSEAASWFHKAAEQGNADAQYRLGVAYADGEAVPKDDDAEAKCLS